MDFKNKVKFTKVRDVKTPERGTEDAAGIDFFLPNDLGYMIVKPGESICVPSGIKLCLNKWTCMQFVNKSSWGKQGLVVGACLVDADYRGEVHLNLWNISKQEILLEGGTKIVQGVILDYLDDYLQEIDEPEFEALPPTSRGSEGFGSTGLH